MDNQAVDTAVQPGIVNQNAIFSKTLIGQPISFIPSKHDAMLTIG